MTELVPLWVPVDRYVEAMRLVYGDEAKPQITWQQRLELEIRELERQRALVPTGTRERRQLTNAISRKNRQRRMAR